MNIAVFADVHGRIALAFDLCARWQQQHNQSIDLILQAGDLGAFPDKNRLDSATIRYARRDPTELGFMQHFTAHYEPIYTLLTQTTMPMIAVRGNHEDHQWLDQQEKYTRDALFPIDAYNRVYVLKTGMPHRINDSLRIMGIGRIGPRSRKRSGKATYIQDYERRRLSRNDHEAVDILLTHDEPFNGRRGMEEIRAYLDRHTPAYHIYGHIGGDAFVEPDSNGATTAIHLADLDWLKDGSLRPGSFGLLRWEDAANHTFTIVDEPWLGDLNAQTWAYRH